MSEYACITNWLSSNNTHISNDKSYFEMWIKGKVTTSRCKEMFMNNNSFPEMASSIISDELFEKWLNSIGRVRKNEAKNL